jgi:hypothetical protein
LRARLLDGRELTHEIGCNKLLYSIIRATGPLSL